MMPCLIYEIPRRRYKTQVVCVFMEYSREDHVYLCPGDHQTSNQLKKIPNNKQFIAIIITRQVVLCRAWDETLGVRKDISDAVEVSTSGLNVPVIFATTTESTGMCGDKQCKMVTDCVTTNAECLDGLSMPAGLRALSQVVG